jgi:hypothetical protein
MRRGVELDRDGGRGRGGGGGSASVAVAVRERVGVSHWLKGVGVRTGNAGVEYKIWGWFFVNLLMLRFGMGRRRRRV